MRHLLAIVLLLLPGVARGAWNDSLVSVWKLNEASGNAADSCGSNTLTDTNTVSSTTGLVYSTVRSFTRTSTQYFTVADNSSLSLGGDINYEFAMWVKATTFTGQQWMLSKDKSGSRSFSIYYDATASRFRWETFADGSTPNNIQANNFGAASTGTWYFVLCGRNADTDLAFVSINNGTKNTAASSSTFDDTSTFRIGGREIGGNTWDGQIGPVYFWKGRVLTTQEESDLYNSGSGKAYPFVKGGGLWYYHLSRNALERALLAHTHSPLAILTER